MSFNSDTTLKTLELPQKLISTTALGLRQAQRIGGHILFSVAKPFILAAKLTLVSEQTWHQTPLKTRFE
ncbi:MAG: hypothetical protein P8Y42_14025 [Exilibacterium sp.]